MKILVLNGPNLNLLGQRQPSIYGAKTLEDIEKAILNRAKSYGAECTFFQSNHEGEIIDYIHQAKDIYDACIINPGALTHTSIALRDAFLAVQIPFVEVHLSNIFAREPFRSNSYLSDCAKGVVSGLGIHGYLVAVDFCTQSL